MRRVIWDWNGTLFDDLEVVIEAVNHGVKPWGMGPITVDDYRNKYTRPVVDFYTKIFGRPVSEVEWIELDHRFHDGYRELLPKATLNSDALAALEGVREAGVAQSLLSMFPHDELMPIVKGLGISEFFDRVDGLRGPTGGLKTSFLEAHLRGLAVADASEVLVVGDTPDDAAAAMAVGARCVLLDGGSHHRAQLEATGATVVGSLLDVVRFL